MTRLTVLVLLTIGLLTACGSKMDANEKNFRIALERYLEKRGELCLELRRWPAEVSEFDMKMSAAGNGGIASEMAALEHAGLVKGEDIVVVEKGMFGGGTERKVRRYALTPVAKPYVRDREARSMGINGTKHATRPDLCWGRKVLARIVKWEGPRADGQYQEAIVTYTYEIAQLAAWAKKDELQQAFNGVRTTIAEAGVKPQHHPVKLTSEGWEAKGLDDWL